MNTDTDRQIAECNASVRRLDAEVLAAIDRRDWTKADRLDRERTKVEKLLTALRATRALLNDIQAITTSGINADLESLP